MQKMRGAPVVRGQVFERAVLIEGDMLRFAQTAIPRHVAEGFANRSPQPGRDLRKANAVGEIDRVFAKEPHGDLVDDRVDVARTRKSDRSQYGEGRLGLR